jgi:hypothetical protein
MVLLELPDRDDNMDLLEPDLDPAGLMYPLAAILGRVSLDTVGLVNVQGPGSKLLDGDLSVKEGLFLKAGVGKVSFRCAAGLAAMLGKLLSEFCRNIIMGGRLLSLFEEPSVSHRRLCLSGAAAATEIIAGSKISNVVPAILS